MKFNLTEPNPGDRVSANLVREIVRAIRSLTPVAGHGVKITQGPNGSVISTAKKNTRKPEKLPWMFSCVLGEDENGNETRTGGWTNGRLQLGIDCRWGTPDVQDDEDYQIEDADSTGDGWHLLEINVNESTCKVIVENSERGSDYNSGIVRIPIGYVTNAKLLWGIHMNPVCYTLL